VSFTFILSLWTYKLYTSLQFDELAVVRMCVKAKSKICQVDKFIEYAGHLLLYFITLISTVTWCVNLPCSSSAFNVSDLRVTMSPRLWAVFSRRTVST